MFTYSLKKQTNNSWTKPFFFCLTMERLKPIHSQIHHLIGYLWKQCVQNECAFEAPALVFLWLIMFFGWFLDFCCCLSGFRFMCFCWFCGLGFLVLLAVLVVMVVVALAAAIEYSPWMFESTKVGMNFGQMTKHCTCILHSIENRETAKWTATKRFKSRIKKKTQPN